MPVEFLSDEQATRYGRFLADPSPEPLALQRAGSLSGLGRAVIKLGRVEKML